MAQSSHSGLEYFAECFKDEAMVQDFQIVAFELRRRIDDLVYRFERATDPAGRVGFKRSDGDYWIIWHPELRWIAGSWADNEVFGRPWDQLEDQSEASPPEGIWVSRKGSKSYVYDLVYVETS